MAFAVIAHDPFSLLPRNSECTVGLVCPGSRSKCVIYRVVEGCLSTVSSFLSEESRNVSFRCLGGGFEFGLSMLEAGCTRSVIRKVALAYGREIEREVARVCRLISTPVLHLTLQRVTYRN